MEKRQKEFIFEIPKEINTDLERTFSFLFPVLKRTASEEFQKMPKGFGMRLQLRGEIKLAKYSFEQNREIIVEQWFPSDSLIALTKRQILKICRRLISQLLARYDSFVQTGSGWVLQKIKRLSFVMMRFKLFQAGNKRQCLPNVLRNSSSLINPPKGTNCFAFAIAIAIASRKKNISRNCHLYEQIVNAMPDYIKASKNVTLKDIQKFEEEWPVSCNIYAFEKKIFPFYVSPFIGSRKYHVQLFVHKNHFYLIKSISALVKKCYKVNRRKCYVCQYCFSYFGSKTNFSTHEKYCNTKGRPIEMPNNDKKMMFFKNMSHLLTVPFVIYADLESAIRQKEETEETKTISKSLHSAISFATISICRENEKFSSQHPTLYTGENCIDNFLEHLEDEVNRITYILRNTNRKIKMSEEDKKHFKLSKRCHFCLREFSSLNFIQKVRDHSHLSGKYRFALCSICNLTQAKLLPKVIVILHGLCNYDSHFIVQKLNKYPDKLLKVIPRTNEKYLSFSVGDVTFKDSYQFISESLSQLAINLKNKGEEYFFSLNRHVKDRKKRDLLTQKGVFPYTYITDLEVLEENRLPSKDKFYNDLGKENISDEEYNFAQKIWSTFKCVKLKDYLQVYLLADLLILADVFENFRSNCYEHYELDPLHYYSNAHFTFDAFLRFSGVKLELLTDINMYCFINKGIRGGLSMVGKRLSHANNIHMAQKYDRTKPSKYIMYFDCNNLYGVAMREYLPHSSFKWLKDINVNDMTQKMLNTPDNSDIGYILEVDMEYPEELHDLHSDYPLAPEKRKISVSQMSPHLREIVEKQNLKVGKVEKLLGTFYDKKNYIIHYRNFKLYISLGMKVKAIHQVLQFHQKPSLKEYIDFNTNKRGASTNTFDINFYKFLNNALFGKTMERPENKTQVKLVNQPETYERCVSKMNFKSSKIINPHLVGIEMGYPTLKINKPLYLGMAIMDLSKCHMFNFHYNVMKKKFSDRLTLLYSDTDSFIYEIYSSNIYEELQDIKEYFDFSNYPKESPLYSVKNKKIPGFFKDESGSKIIEKFAGLRSKMYSIKMLEDDELKVAKGVKKAVIKNDLTYEDYEKCLTENIEMEHSFYTLRSKSHQVYTAHQSKKSLSPYDDKRWLINNFESIPYGHFKAKKHSLKETVS